MSLTFVVQKIYDYIAEGQRNHPDPDEEEEYDDDDMQGRNLLVPLCICHSIATKVTKIITLWKPAGLCLHTCMFAKRLPLGAFLSNLHYRILVGLMTILEPSNCWQKNCWQKIVS